jgi:cell volume regulation protein A
MDEINYLFAGSAILLLMGIFSSKLSARFNVPILLMFLGIGMLAGSDGIGGIEFADAKIASLIGTLAMSFILFSGGMDTHFRSIKSVLVPGGVLATIGVMLTALIVGVGACFILGCSFEWGLLLGAVVSSTDAAAVFAILRSKGVSLRGKLKPLLELESGSNDPMAALLTIFMIDMLKNPNSSFLMFIPVFFAQMAVGIAWGYCVGRAGAWLFSKSKLEFEGLYFVLGVALVLVAYGFAGFMFGNGFMAVYVCGLTMGNRRFNFKKGLGRFHDGVSWLMQVVLFTTLGLLMFPRQLPEIAVSGSLLALVLMLVARPAAVFTSMIGSEFNLRERILVSWVGLRGAAPIVLATFPMMAGNRDAGLLLNLVFFIVITSVLIQGRTLMPLARLLKLDSPLDGRVRPPLELEEADSISSKMFEFTMAPDSAYVGMTVAELKLPSGVLIQLIRRGGRFLLAHGNTVLEAGDGIMMMGDAEVLKEVAEKYFPEADVEEILL